MGHSHEHQDSGDTEFYTPEIIVEAARKTLGVIDLDPASSTIANEVVKARNYYIKEVDGLRQTWFGNVWMNHPFHKGEEVCKPKCKKKTCVTRGYHLMERIPSNSEWIGKLVDSYLVGDIDQACCITWANMPEAWMAMLLPFPQCFPHGRIHYRNVDGTTKRGAPKGSIITYLGPDVQRFADAFKHIGTTKVAI